MYRQVPEPTPKVRPRGSSTVGRALGAVSYTHLRAHQTSSQISGGGVGV